MEPNVTAIERAFQLARLGIFLQVAEIKERLGYFTESSTDYSSHSAQVHHAKGAKNSMEARSFLC